MSGAELIAAERERQVRAEGWSAAHDDQHDRCELLDAALCYAGVAGSQILDSDKGKEAATGLLEGWPWDASWWKPTPNDPVRNLVKAGALIAAEIDRLIRADEANRAEAKDPAAQQATGATPREERSAGNSEAIADA